MSFSKLQARFSQHETKKFRVDLEHFATFFTARRAWKIVRRAQEQICTSAQLPRDAPVHGARPTRQSHPTVCFGAAL